jgi:short-chain fatty acids transporter
VSIEQADETQEKEGIPAGRLAGLGLAFAGWSERWFPDAFVFALLGIIIAFIAGVLLGEKPWNMAIQAGKGFWVLVPFTMNMVMIVLGGYALATAPVIYRLIERIARIPRSPRGAVATVAIFSMATSLISWGFSLIFSGLLVREVVRRKPGLDLRSLGAAAYLGLGSIWALGLSSSAALLMASRESIPPALGAISGVIPLTQTIFLRQSMLMALLIFVAATMVAYLSAPPAGKGRTAESFGLHYEPPLFESAPPSKPGEWLEHSPLLTILASSLLVAYLVNLFRTSPQGPLAALDLGTYNLLFLVLAMLLHGSPKRFLKAIHEAVPATGGVLIQFPFYAAIFGMITGTGISAWLAHLFTALTTKATFPLLVALYSSTLGVFVPSGGSKWIIEAPYVLQAASIHQVHMGWVVQIYNASEALPNLINPFWMLPLLGILRLKARDLVGYTMLQLLIQGPLVFLLCAWLAGTLHYVPPAH